MRVVRGRHRPVLGTLAGAGIPEPGAVALAEWLTGGRYGDITIRRADAARLGLPIADVQAVLSTAVGGDNMGEVVDGAQRFPINQHYPHYPREMRDSVAVYFLMHRKK